jgi:CubicO group peptidase (beta-lactamase class C family)
MEQYVENKEIAGAALLIRRAGEIIVQACFGYADLAKQEPVTERSVFRLASMTKPIAAAAIMLLADQGRLHLDDALAEFLPDFADKPGVTVRHLLNHSSGLAQDPEGIERANGYMDPADRLADRVRKWAKLPLDFEPGTRTGYSPLVGFDLLGRIVEVVSGEELQTFFQKRLFEPLGIRDLTYLLTPEQQSRLVRLYEAGEGTLTDVTDTEPLWSAVDAMKNGYFSGGAGLYGTLEDYDKFVQMLAGDGLFQGVRLLKPETVRLMRTPSSELLLSPGLSWGLGMIVYLDPAQNGLPMSAGSYGWSGAFGTHFFIDVAKQLHVTLMINRSNIGGAGSYISREVEKLTYEIFG